MKKNKILYFSAMRICSGRANMIQSIFTIKYFANYIDTFCIYPARFNDHISKRLSVQDAIADFLDEKIDPFNFKRIPTIDLPILEKINSKIWFYILIISYCIGALKYLISKEFTHIYVRESLLALFVIILKNLLRLKTLIIYESHNESVLDRFIIENSKITVCISRYLYIKYSKKYSDKKLLLAEDAARRKINKSLKIPEKICKVFEINKNKCKILYVGSTFDHKGYSFLLKSSHILPEEFHMILIGGSIKEMNQNKKIIDKSKVSLFSEIEYKYISRIIQKSDILLLPNLNHRKNLSTSPLKLYEYLLSNKPIIFSDIQSFKDVLISQPYCYSFKSGNKVDFIEKLKIIFSQSSSFSKIFREVNSWEKRSKLIIDKII